MCACVCGGLPLASDSVGHTAWSGRGVFLATGEELFSAEKGPGDGLPLLLVAVQSSLVKFFTQRAILKMPDSTTFGVDRTI